MAKNWSKLVLKQWYEYTKVGMIYWFKGCEPGDTDQLVLVSLPVEEGFFSEDHRG